MQDPSDYSLKAALLSTGLEEIAETIATDTYGTFFKDLYRSMTEGSSLSNVARLTPIHI